MQKRHIAKMKKEAREREKRDSERGKLATPGSVVIIPPLVTAQPPKGKRGEMGGTAPPRPPDSGNDDSRALGGEYCYGREVVRGHGTESHEQQHSSLAWSSSSQLPNPTASGAVIWHPSYTEHVLAVHKLGEYDGIEDVWNDPRVRFRDPDAVEPSSHQSFNDVGLRGRSHDKGGYDARQCYKHQRHKAFSTPASMPALTPRHDPVIHTASFPVTLLGLPSSPTRVAHVTDVLIDLAADSGYDLEIDKEQGMIQWRRSYRDEEGRMEVVEPDEIRRDIGRFVAALEVFRDGGAKPEAFAMAFNTNGMAFSVHGTPVDVNLPPRSSQPVLQPIIATSTRAPAAAPAALPAAASSIVAASLNELVDASGPRSTYPPLMPTSAQFPETSAAANEMATFEPVTPPAIILRPTMVDRATSPTRPAPSFDHSPARPAAPAPVVDTSADSSTFNGASYATPKITLGKVDEEEISLSDAESDGVVMAEPSVQWLQLIDPTPRIACRVVNDADDLENAVRVVPPQAHIPIKAGVETSPAANLAVAPMPPVVNNPASSDDFRNVAPALSCASTPTLSGKAVVPFNIVASPDMFPFIKPHGPLDRHETNSSSGIDSSDCNDLSNSDSNANTVCTRLACRLTLSRGGVSSATPPRCPTKPAASTWPVNPWLQGAACATLSSTSNGVNKVEQKPINRLLAKVTRAETAEGSFPTKKANKSLMYESDEASDSKSANGRSKKYCWRTGTKRGRSDDSEKEQPYWGPEPVTPPAVKSSEDSWATDVDNSDAPARSSTPHLSGSATSTWVKPQKRQYPYWLDESYKSRRQRPPTAHEDPVDHPLGRRRQAPRTLRQVARPNVELVEREDRGGGVRCWRFRVEGVETDLVFETPREEGFRPCGAYVRIHGLEGWWEVIWGKVKEELVRADDVWRV
ncbi:hypothetical protein HK101_000960 [Irineochytrium annulatum]|nr:hypothetical protein HK101_000960 [Irineochytrium annulatum]